MTVAAPAKVLELFHPTIARWFTGALGEPTEIQRLAWPEIASGAHVLVTAPTGSGKTLTAFLWALDRLLTGAWEGGSVRVLYVSPLRALNNDIRRNLLAPLAGLEEAFAAAGESSEPVRVQTRSGDTPQSERQRMIRRPPEILITTPESLNILLTSRGGRSILGGVVSVILDEIHAVAGTKRGTHLITAVERLAGLSGELQRVALSATVQPLERVARFVGGYTMERGAEGAEPRYTPRPVTVVRSAMAKEYDLRVVAPEGAAATAPPRLGPGAPEDEIPDPWKPVAGAIRDRIRANRSTLVFANSRRTTEKVTRLLNETEPSELAYSHHGSLSRELRAVVEERLKDGRLSGIVATNSLELGIDIGALDEVVLLQTPPTVASAVQRIGRAGHGVGEVSRGRLYPLQDRDLLDAAVVARGVLEGDIEEIRPIEGPLDVLAQVLLSMLAAEPRAIDELYDVVRTSYPYRHLTRQRFDLVLEMLAGRYADSRIRELHPRVAIDRVAGTVRARPGAARLVYLSGGTIPDRGYFQLRLADTMAKLGELDEEFVWERSTGDTFSLGAQAWRIQKITHNDVLVTPAMRSAAMPPFWRAEERNRSYHLSSRLGAFLERAERLLASRGGGDELAGALTAEHAMEEPAARRLVGFLSAQRAATGGPLPHPGHLLLEHPADGAGREDKETVIFHLGWGGRVLRPFALALQAAWRAEHGWPLELEHDNDCLMVALPRGEDPHRVLELVRADNLEKLLLAELEHTGFFGARFRENAGRALLLPRSGWRRRVPLWLNRERAKKLMAAVARYDDFPLRVETWRTCLEDEFDLENLKRELGRLERREVEITSARTATPSPFAGNLMWKQTNRLMYEDDTPDTTPGGPRSDLLRELVFSSALRPRIPAAVLDRFQRKLQRTWPGYAPATADDLVDWVEERLVIPHGEWLELLDAIARDGRVEEGPATPGTRAGMVAGTLAAVAARLVEVDLPAPASGGAGAKVVVSVGHLPRLLAALGLEPDGVQLTALQPAGGASAADVAALAARTERAFTVHAEGAGAGGGAAEPEGDPLASLVAEWLRYYGPVPERHLEETFAVARDRARDLLETLIDAETVVLDRFREGDEDAVPLELCDADNLERLLRLTRAAARPEFRALPAERLPQFLATWQGLATPADGVEGLQAALDRLLGYAAPARLWESDLLPARLDPYYPAWLDSLLQESELLWLGCGPERITFTFPDDLDLLRDEAEAEAEGEGADTPASPQDIAALFPDPRARYPLEALARHSGLDTAPLTHHLWELAWAGRVTNTAFGSLRQGLLNRFRPAEPAADRWVSERREQPARRPGRRRGFDRWRSSRPFGGDWLLVDPDLHPDGGGEREPLDALDREELAKDRARLLLARYGVLFRELLERELPALRWGRVFRALRLMELSGEVLAGHFFAGVPGLQFASPAAFRLLEEGLPDDALVWMSAADPASPSGLALEGLQGVYPSRLPSNHLVFHGPRLVAASRRHGAELELHLPPDDLHLLDSVRFLEILLTRQFDPRRGLKVETINGDPAATSPYAPRLAERFQATREAGAVKLRRRYGGS